MCGRLRYDVFIRLLNNKRPTGLSHVARNVKNAAKIHIDTYFIKNNALYS